MCLLLLYINLLIVSSQLFAGTDENPLAFCNDPSVDSERECVGEFRIRIETSREFLPLNDSTFPVTRILVPRVWYGM